MGKIIYLGHFKTFKNSRRVFPPAQTLIQYMRRAINDAGYSLTMVSLAPANEPCERVEQIINDKTKVIFAKNFKAYKKNILMRLVTRLKRERSLLKELDEIIEDGDTLISYHSLSTMRLIKKLRKKKSFKFILQVCEVYADVKENKRLRKKEIEFIKGADKYILISDLLKKEIGLEDKECIVCSGTYKKEDIINEPPGDGKIHVVYAGTLDEKKGGAYFAISSAKYLNEKYHVHILGAATEEQKNKLKMLVDKVKSETSCDITYDGYKNGKELTSFLQGCHIGLSTQNPQGAYNATSFPSKILVYLANGLNVVSVRIPAIEFSPVGQAMHFYESSTDKDIARAILSVDFNGKDAGRELVGKLNDEFVKNIKKLLEE